MDNEDLEVVATYLATKREIAKHKAVITSVPGIHGFACRSPEEATTRRTSACLRTVRSDSPGGLSWQHWYKADVDFEQVIQSIAALHRLLPKQRELAPKMRGVGQAEPQEQEVAGGR